MAIHWNKDYITYNNGQFETRQLNFFQRGLRVLGCYSNTRLARVAQLAIESFYKPETSYNAALLNLAKKAVRLQKIDGTFQIESINPTVSYSGKFLQNGSTSFKVKLIQEDRAATINIKPVQARGLIVSELYELDFPKHFHFTENENDPLVKAAYPFIAEVLLNSPRINTVSIQGNRVGSEAIARANGYDGKDLSSGLTLDEIEAIKFLDEDFHEISMNAFSASRNPA